MNLEGADITLCRLMYPGASAAGWGIKVADRPILLPPSTPGLSQRLKCGTPARFDTLQPSEEGVSDRDEYPDLLLI